LTATAPNTPVFDSQARNAFILATGAFALSFAVRGLVSALAPAFKSLYNFSHTQVSLLIAIPV
jgi:nitrate/nitrite transporter NarK